MTDKYRKKPVVIEAIQWTGENLREVLNFTGKAPRWSEWFSRFDEYEAHVRSDRNVFKVFTLEGIMEAGPGDWIIRGVSGEHYPCKPDIFAKTYEAADALEAQAEHVAVVKPLVWRYTAEGTNLPRYEADALGQTYIVTFDNCAHDDIAWVVRIFGRWSGHPTIDAAKAAAQADYNRRILSAITIRSADEVRAEGYAAGIDAAEAMCRVMARGFPVNSECELAIAALFAVSAEIRAIHTADSLAALERVRQEANRFETLAADHAQWSQATFGADDERDFRGPLAHMGKEIGEIEAAPDDGSEWADLFLLLLDAARRAGFPSELLLAEAELKLEINKARKWQAPNADGSVEHVRAAAIMENEDE